jgi:alpha-galactosidase
MSGTFGYELNPEKLTDLEKREIRQQIVRRNRFGEIILKGDYYRLTDPVSSDLAAWMFVSRDGKEALLNVVNLEIHGNRPVSYVRLNGLQKGASYVDEATGKVYPADMLMQAGMPVLITVPAFPPTGEYLSAQIFLKKLD